VQSLGAKGMELVEELFCKPIEVRPLVSRQLQDEEDVRIRLTEEQSLTLRHIRYRRRAAVFGGAGTGKTLLALEHARFQAEHGKKTLLLCFNAALGDFLKLKAQGIAGLDVMTFHDLCMWRCDVVRHEKGKDLMREAARDYPGADPAGVHAPHALALSLDEAPLPYQAIIIDEAQDFRDTFWLPIEMHLDRMKETTFFIFYDQNQTLYQRTAEFPIRDEVDHFVLDRNCRNTKPIHDAAYRYYRGIETACPALPGAQVEQLCAAQLAQQAELLSREVERLIGEQGVNPLDIAVLVLDPKTQQPCRALLEKHKLPRGAGWAFRQYRQPSRVVVDTVGRFKGLEAPVILLWVANELTAPEPFRELLYVGLSRPCSRLYLVGSPSTCRTVLSAAR
jgi:hypothetical protein